MRTYRRRNICMLLRRNMHKDISPTTMKEEEVIDDT